MYKVLITDAVHQNMIQLFEEEMVAVTYSPDITLDQTLQVIEDYDMLVINSKIVVDKKFLDKAIKLKIIGRLGSGKEIVDIVYAVSKNIIFHNSPEGNRDAVAEHGIGLILALLNNIPKAFQEVQQLKWIREENRGHEISNKTIALIGYGNTGEAIAKRLSVFGCKLLVYDKYKSGFQSSIVNEATLIDIHNEADIVSLHIPLTNETTYLVNEQFINAFRKNFYLINTSRGKIVAESAVLAGLKSGKILGFASDVLEDEKINLYTDKAKEKILELMQFNTIITPHIAGWTYESKEKLGTILAKKMLMSLKNQ